MEDIRDIIIAINDYNNNYNNNQYIINSMITCDINSMYDVITKNDLFAAFNYSIFHLLPIDYISNELIDLWIKAVNHMFDNAYFTFYNI